jgi:long-chain acyl-CoA synthetase
VLGTHPGIGEAVCIGVPDAEMGERVLALVVRQDPELDAQAVLDYCRERLTHYKCPREVEFVAALERNALGKINKRALRAPYWEPADSGSAGR